MPALLGPISEFTLGESLLSPEDIVVGAVANGFDVVTLTDTTLSSMMDFTKACDKHQVKPIMGLSLRIFDDPLEKVAKKDREKKNRFFNVKVYAKNDKGIQSLYRLQSLANTKDHFHYQPRLGLTELLDELLDGNVAVSSGAFWSIFTHPDYKQKWRAISHVADGSAFVELVAVDNPYFNRVNQIALEVGSPANFIVSRPVLYKDNEDADTLDILKTITSQSKMSVPYRSIQQYKEFSFYKPDIYEQFVHQNEKLVEQCTFHWQKQPISLPQLFDDEFEELRRLCVEGWKDRFSKPQLGHKPTDLQPYKERLAYELRILKQMGFVRYFLLVNDVLRWAKDNDVRVGPARGSSAGSLVAYLTHITDIDPIRFGTLFERFINPDRLDLPDIDMDIATSGRDKVLNYIVEKYGRENVSGIMNFSTLASASALREVCRVHEMDINEYSATKLVPSDAGKSFELNQAADVVPELNTFRAKHVSLWKHAVKLQGQMRNFGVHAAGVCVAGEPIIHRGALTTRNDGLPIVVYDKRTVEDQGLIKLDLLGLSTLDIHKIALDLIKQRRGKEVNLMNVHLDDPRTLEAFGKGETEAVFQFESYSAKSILKGIGESGSFTFEDLVAVNALNRPAALGVGSHEKYVAVAQGRQQPARLHPLIDPILRRTNGVLLYQEQTMEVLREFSGFTMGESDFARRIIGKKQLDKLEELKANFTNGAVRVMELNGEPINDLLIDQIWSFIEAAGKYQFNKSHSASYSLIAYWSMYLKVHFKAEFYAASMSVLDTDKLPALVKAAEGEGIKILPPDVNDSQRHYAVVERDGATCLVAPFSAIKGLGKAAEDAILTAREQVGGRFTSFVDFIETVNKRPVNKNIQSVLDRVGAFANLEPVEKDLQAKIEKLYPSFSLIQSPVSHPDRAQDQLELLPGIMQVKRVSRVISKDKDIVNSLNEGVLYPIFGKADPNDLTQWIQTPCQKCDFAGKRHVPPRFGKDAKAMVVTDCPSYGEENKNKMIEGLGDGYVREALSAAGLSVSDFYWTTLVKSKKNKGGSLKPDQIGACSVHLNKEIEILKPGLIIALGSQALKNLLKVQKLSQDDTNTVIFSKELNAAVLVGFNPQMVYVKSEMQAALNEVFATAKTLLPD